MLSYQLSKEEQQHYAKLLGSCGCKLATRRAFRRIAKSTMLKALQLAQSSEARAEIEDALNIDYLYRTAGNSAGGIRVAVSTITGEPDKKNVYIMRKDLRKPNPLVELALIYVLLQKNGDIITHAHIAGWCKPKDMLPWLPKSRRSSLGIDSTEAPCAVLRPVEELKDYIAANMAVV